MNRGEPKRLTAEDRILWSRVARTARPLSGKRHPEEDPPAPEAEQAVPAPPPGEGGCQAPAATPAGRERLPRRLDLPTRQKLARGRLEIAGRVDLHGLTQEEAHALLLTFLRRAHAGDRRHVLVITGKGSGRSEGVLRRAVPQWLSTPPFAQVVSGYDEAARHHGGAGAIYVRLRRRRDRE